MDISSLLYRAETQRTIFRQMMAGIRKRIEGDTEKLENLEDEASTIEELTLELEMVADRLAALLDGTEERGALMVTFYHGAHVHCSSCGLDGDKRYE